MDSELTQTSCTPSSTEHDDYVDLRNPQFLSQPVSHLVSDSDIDGILMYIIPSKMDIELYSAGGMPLVSPGYELQPNRLETHPLQQTSENLPENTSNTPARIDSENNVSSKTTKSDLFWNSTKDKPVCEISNPRRSETAKSFSGQHVLSNTEKSNMSSLKTLFQFLISIYRY